MTRSKTSTANRPGGNLQRPQAKPEATSGLQLLRAASGGFAFITEISLIVDSSQEKELLSRFQAGRQLYNALRKRCDGTHGVGARLRTLSSS